MDAARRLALLRWARQAGAWVFENDNDSQYRFAGRPVAALQGLDRDGRVIYYGDFIIVLGRALSLGYLVVPPTLVDAFTAAHFARALSAPILQQAVLADFMTEGRLVRHMRRMRQLYAARRARLVDALRHEVAGLLEVRPAEAGACLIGWLPHGVDDRAAEQGVTVSPLSAYSAQPLHRGALLFGSAAVDGPEVVNGARRLAVALRRAASQNHLAASQYPEPMVESVKVINADAPDSRIADVDDSLWEQLAPLLPPAPSHARGGRPRMPDRDAFEAILYVLRTGIAWKALPREMGAGTTVHARFQTWARAGVFGTLCRTGLTTHAALSGIAWASIAGEKE